MKQLRRSIIFMVILIGITFNIERLDIMGTEDVINIASFNYGLYGLAVLSTLAFPFIRRISLPLLWTGWVSVYFIGKLIVFAGRPLVGGIYTYLTIVELTLLSLALLAAYRVTNDVFDIEETVANITLQDVSSRVVDFDDASDDIALELVRSRRYSSPLSVMIVKLDPESVPMAEQIAVKDIMKSMLIRYTSSSLVRALDKELRRTDMIIKQPRKNRLILLFPETDSSGTKTMIDRIEEISKHRLGIPVSCGYATFPDEALTFDELVQRAESHFSNQSVHFADYVADKVDEISKSS